MLIIIPSSTAYTATVRGSVTKELRCEACGEDYSYTMFREASGSDSGFLFHSSAQERAFTKARENLQRMLEFDQDDVPCPSCRHHQSHVVEARRKARRLGAFPEMMNLSGAFLIFAAAVLGIMLAILGVSVFVNDQPWPEQSVVLNCAIAVGVIAAPGLLLRGLRKLLLLFR